MPEKDKFNPDEFENLMDHDYDGIRELDNRLPPWWVWLFYITIFWAVGYMFYYHFLGIGDLSKAEYMKEIDPNWDSRYDDTYRPLLITRAFRSPYYSPEGDVTPQTLAKQAGAPAPAAAKKEEPEEELNYEPLTDAESLANGKAIFLQNCAVCHGNLGEGTIGPNLTDEYWIHGDGKINDIIRTIRNGVPVKGMIAWKSVLRPIEIHQVASYVLSLQGSNPPNAKAPEGKKVTGE